MSELQNTLSKAVESAVREFDESLPVARRDLKPSVCWGLLAAFLMTALCSLLFADSQWAQKQMQLVQTAWQAHAGILAISATVFVLLVQGAAGGRLDKGALLEEIAAQSLLYPGMAFGMSGLVLWTLVAVVQGALGRLLPGVILSAYANSFLTVFIIIYWYTRVPLMYSPVWAARSIERRIENAIWPAVREDLRQTVTFHAFHQFLSQNDTLISFDQARPRSCPLPRRADRGYKILIGIQL